MAEYIDKANLVERLESRVKDYGRDCNGNAPIISRTYQAVLHMVENLPTADVVPVEWISVKDRLPETNGKYLCANYSKTLNRYFIEVLSFAKDLHKVDEFDFKEEKGKSGFYMYDSEWGYSHFRNVTHWMPLPEPPKEIEGIRDYVDEIWETERKLLRTVRKQWEKASKQGRK